MSYSSSSKTRLPGVPNNVKPRGVKQVLSKKNIQTEYQYSPLKELLIKEVPQKIAN